MSKAVRAAWHVQCCGKNKYRTYNAALDAARTVTALYNDPMRPYKCPHCRRYHIGHGSMKQSTYGS